MTALTHAYAFGAGLSLAGLWVMLRPFRLPERVLGAVMMAAFWPVVAASGLVLIAFCREGEE